MKFNTNLTWSLGPGGRAFYGKEYNYSYEEPAPCEECEHADTCKSGKVCPAFKRYMRVGKRWNRPDQSVAKKVPDRGHR